MDAEKSAKLTHTFVTQTSIAAASSGPEKAGELVIQGDSLEDEEVRLTPVRLV